MAEKTVYMHLVSIPDTQEAIDRLEACVADIEGNIIEVVNAEAHEQHKATIIFDENLDK